MIQGSTEIIDFLERTLRERSLTPADPNDANSAIQWEKYLDEEIGVTLRLWFYYYTPLTGSTMRSSEHRFWSGTAFPELT